MWVIVVSNCWVNDDKSTNYGKSLLNLTNLFIFIVILFFDLFPLFKTRCLTVKYAYRLSTNKNFIN